MSKSAFDYSVRLPFPARAASPDWLGSKFLATLDALTKIDSNIFPDWEVGDLPAMKGYPLAVARSRIAKIIGRSVSHHGYTALALTTMRIKSRRMKLWVNPWNVWLKAGDEMVPPDQAIVTYPLFKAALLAINAIWPAPWACAQAFRSASVWVPNIHANGSVGYKLQRTQMISSEPTFPESVFHIPWIPYLSAPLALGANLPPEITTERTPDGGLLMIATTERLDPTNPEHVRSAHILAETLIARTDYSSS